MPLWPCANCTFNNQLESPFSPHYTIIGVRRLIIRFQVCRRFSERDFSIIYLCFAMPKPGRWRLVRSFPGDVAAPTAAAAAGAIKLQQVLLAPRGAAFRSRWPPPFGVAAALGAPISVSIYVHSASHPREEALSCFSLL